MKTPYLIQQASFLNKSDQGLDGILKFTYMGSAEFENGALYESLQRIRKVENTLFHLSIGDKIVSVYCNDKDTVEVQKYIRDLANDKYQLKSMSGFNYWIYDGNMRRMTADFLVGH